MNHTDKLSLLLRIFNCTNSKLARAINVDPSLVCKWHTGKRLLRPDSVYARDIMDYLLSEGLKQYQKELLAQILGIPGKEIECLSHTDLKGILSGWLFSDTGKNCVALNREAAVASGINAVAGEADNPNNCEIGIVNIFRGKQGKREAISALIGKLGSVGECPELLIYDEENLEWLTEDEDYLKNIYAISKHLVSLGCKINIVHNISRDPSEMMPLLKFWIPLYLTGNVKAYGCMKRPDNVHNKAIYIVRNSFIVMSVSTGISNSDSCILTSSEQTLVSVAENLFGSFLKKCKPFTKIYKNKDIVDLHKSALDIDSKLGKHYILRSGLSILTMPLENYSNLLNASSLTEQEKMERLSIHAKRTENIWHNIKTNKYIEIIDTEYFDRFDQDRLLIYRGYDIANKDACKCKHSDYIAHLKNTIHLLRTYDNYEIIPFRHSGNLSFKNLCIEAKEDSAITVSSSDDAGYNPIAIRFNEDVMVNFISYYLDNIHQYVPEPMLDKKYVLKKLEDILAIAEGWV